MHYFHLRDADMTALLPRRCGQPCQVGQGLNVLTVRLLALLAWTSPAGTVETDSKPHLAKVAS